MNDNHFKIIDSDNKEKNCHILHQFERDNNKYMIYTDDTFDDNGELNIYSSKYKIENNEIIPLEINENEWEIINEEWRQVNNE